MRGRTYEITKRWLDVVAAITLMILLLPIYLLVGIVVLFSLGRPILFVQSRPGLNEKPFNLIKFRTMRPPGAKDTSSEAARLTRVGQFLRSTSLDEIPSFWNILRGEMSFVGPRPLLPEYLPLYSDRHRQRHSVKPGLTGLAQINGRNLLEWGEKLDFDVEYVNSRSIRLDVRIIVSTAGLVLRRIGVNQSKDISMSPLTNDYDK